MVTAREEAAPAPEVTPAVVVIDGLSKLAPEPTPKKKSLAAPRGKVIRATGTVTTNQIWTAWSEHTSVTSNSYTLSTDDIWTTWYGDTSNTISYSCTTTGTSTAIWDAWADTHEYIAELRVDCAGTARTINAINHYSRKNISEEELRRDLEREKERRLAAEKRAAEAELAKHKAEMLLLGHLSPKQRDDLVTKGCFYVEIPHENGKIERYRIDRGSHGNVKQLDEKGSIIRSFCVQPPDCPAGDAMLAQKLFLEASEETRREFWEIANITEYNDQKRLPFQVPRKARREHALAHGLLLH